MNHNDILSDQDLRRFEDQIALPQIGPGGQKKLKNANIAVIGAGGLGAVVLQYLAASGIGHLAIIDHSMVEETSIQRQTLYGGNDLGKLKTIISREHLQSLFPLIHFDILNLRLSADNALRILQPFELIVDASNDEVSHEIISDACRRLKLPWIYGSILNFKGEVAVFDKNTNASYRNMKHIAETGEDNPLKAASVAYGFIGVLMALEVIKLLVSSPESLLDRILSVDLLTYQFDVKSLI